MLQPTVLFAVAIAVGFLVFLCRFLPTTGRVPESSIPPAPHLDQGILPLVICTPITGLLLALIPKFGVLFHNGSHLGYGFFLGGFATLLAVVDLFKSATLRKPAATTLLMASAYGIHIVAVVIALLVLRQSLFDALLGVAIGGFCTTFALYSGLTVDARSGATGRRVGVSGAFLIVLALVAGLGIFRDPLTPDLAKQTWSAIVMMFAALGTMVVAGLSLLPGNSSSSPGRLWHRFVVIGLTGFGLYAMASKIAGNQLLAICGIGGLLLWPILYAILQDEQRTVRRSTTGPLSLPMLTVVVMSCGFLAALQTFQGLGAGILVLSLFLVCPMTSHNDERDFSEGEQNGAIETANQASGLLLFATVLLAWRFFITRWSDDLRGVNLTDQYALFGILIGAALPGFLARVPIRSLIQKETGSGRIIATLLLCTVLTLASPIAVLVLFGAKSTVALLIGLAVGTLPFLVGRISLFPALFAIGISLVLAQFTGVLLPKQAPTRMIKIRYLAGILATGIAALFVANRLGKSTQDDEEAN